MNAVRIKQALISAAIFAVIVLMLVSVDERVRDRVTALTRGGDGLGGLGTRLTALADAGWTAARHQSIDNGPLVVFAAVGALLFVFMVRT
jgi:hypothetical protein